jgi:hypothetical protein
MTNKELIAKLLKFNNGLLSGQSATMYDIDGKESYGVYCINESAYMSVEGWKQKYARPMNYVQLIERIGGPVNEDMEAFFYLNSRRLFKIQDVQIGDDCNEQQLVMVGRKVKA